MAMGKQETIDDLHARGISSERTEHSTQAVVTDI